MWRGWGRRVGVEGLGGVWGWGRRVCRGVGV